MKWVPSIHIGTSGWSYKHWKNIFYPDKLTPEKWLAFYEQHFNATEINNSFYHLPSTSTTSQWSKSVQSGFVFCPKMSRYLSHMKKLKDPEESMQRFFDAFLPLKRKIGPVLVQLPASVKFQPEKTEAFYRLCKTQYSYYRFALEVRHRSWLTDESIALMRKYNIAFVISQSGAGFPYAEIVTADHIYIRLHGPGDLYASGYSDAELKHFAGLLKGWKKQGKSVWIFFNNDIHGYAVRDAAALKSLINVFGS